MRVSEQSVLAVRIGCNWKITRVACEWVEFLAHSQGTPTSPERLRSFIRECKRSCGASRKLAWRGALRRFAADPGKWRRPPPSPR